MDKMNWIAVVGGRLQGIEACYLARHAGMKTVLIDRDPEAPAQGMCDVFLCADLLEEDPEILSRLQAVDMVMPTTENEALLEKLAALKDRLGLRLAFDWTAYQITSSKKQSDALFHAMEIPAPRYYPEGSFPYIAKMDKGSGSHGVVRLDTEEMLQAWMKEAPEDMLVQEYLEGPSYSVEVVGRPGCYRTYGITRIWVDPGYDCNRVTIPCDELSESMQSAFAADAVRLAERLRLVGIMDCEAILHEGKMKILEIDARIPSQTPTAVLQATGMNELEDLFDLIVTGQFQTYLRDEGRHACYEHYLRTPDALGSPGEHIMAEGGVLTLQPCFGGVDEIETDYYSAGDGKPFRATVINSGKTREEMEEKRKKAYTWLLGLPLHRNRE